MNTGRHWTDFDEAQLAAMKAGRVHASRSGHGAAHLLPRPHVARDVTADTRRFLDTLPTRAPVDPGPAYDPAWLPEIQATQTPADWMRDGNAPDPHLQRNGTAPPSVPEDDAYPREWLQGFGGLGGGALGGEGFLTDGGRS